LKAFAIRHFDGVTKFRNDCQVATELYTENLLYISQSLLRDWLDAIWASGAELWRRQTNIGQAVENQTIKHDSSSFKDASP
jgi:hypothetical protein